MRTAKKQMIGVLSGEHRAAALQAVAELVVPKVSSILDLGCGIGVLAFRLTEQFPSTMIVALDVSGDLLGELRRTRRRPNILLVQGEAPQVPFRPGTFDLCIAVQVLHEILHFKGRAELTRTLAFVHELLRTGGEFIVLDHENPGDTSISAHLSLDQLQTLHKFQQRFTVRPIVYQETGGNWIRTSLRDFYDFVTKIWALGTPLEDEEMRETHTPFTPQEFSRLIRQAGFKVTRLASITPIDAHLTHYKIRVKSPVQLPARHLLLRARKDKA
jgi:ubiquinone/menaquinone biosynthesis C-methylase UbiE